MIFAKSDGCAFRAYKKLAVKPEQIAAIGITNQRETVVVWDKMTGNPFITQLFGSAEERRVYANSLKPRICRFDKIKTGLVLDAYFSGTRIKWILENVKEVKKESSLRYHRYLANIQPYQGKSHVSTCPMLQNHVV